MHRLLEAMKSRQDEIVAMISELAKIESPSSDRAAVNRAVDFVAEAAKDIATVERIPQTQFGDHLRLEFDLPGESKDGQILGLGHLDTVYPLGTLERMPVRVADRRLWGPGVFDMKGGVVYFLYAARVLRELGVPVRRRFVVQLNADEEVGSPSSRPFTEAEAGRSAAVLVAEPSYGREGRAKTSRKGGGRFMIRVKGRSSHAGLDFFAGASAVVELARQIEKVAAWSDAESGVTINPGVIAGGTVSNVVAESAWCEVDVRVPTLESAREIEGRFAALTPFDDRTQVTVEGGLRRPPLERTQAIARLYETAHEVSATLGIELGEASVGGGSDGNFTAALGVPTLDGLGAVGEGAHSENESIWLDRVADRAALIGALVATL